MFGKLTKGQEIGLLANLARLHSKDLVAMAIKSTSEEQTLADTLEALGIEFYRHNAPGHASPEKEFDPKAVQEWMVKNGFNLTIHATGAIVQGDLVHFFSCTSPEFTAERVESGSYLFTLNKKTGEYKKHKTRTLTATE